MITGIIAVIIFLSILILVHELGHFLTAKKFGLLVEEFGLGLPPRIWGKKIGETVYSINALPFGGFVKIYGEDGINADSRGLNADLRGRCFLFKPVWQRAVIIAAGVVMNFLLGWLVISLVFSIGIPQAVMITDVRPDSPALAAGLAPNDKIIGFQKVDELVKYIDQNRGKEITLEIERLDKTLDIKTTPRVNPPAGEGALGIGLVEAGLAKQGIVKSFIEGFKTSVGIIQAIFLALFNLISKVFVGEAGLEQVTGPVGIVKITAQAGSMGFIYLLQLLALISLNLAVINIFPFPALDGGRLLFLLIEKIKGSPLPVKFERYANTAGMALLLLLMAAITIKDIGRFF